MIITDNAHFPQEVFGGGVREIGNAASIAPVSLSPRIAFVRP